jgi:catechol 2,3-dioxygenase-like lactoylglutathione lyase family enzyme
MFDHISVGVDDHEKSTQLYDSVLATIGWKQVYTHGEIATGYGPKERPVFWVQRPGDGKPASAGNGMHICFSARSRDEVHAFYDAAIAGGASDAGAPGLRPEYTPTYYGAFFYDFTGHKIEVVCHGE